MRRKRSSRLARTSERQNKRQAIIFAVSTIFVIIILLQFGPLLINVFGNVVYTLRGGDSAENSQITGNALLQPPTLLGIPSATQSAEVSFSGVAPSSEGIIEIYLNDELEEEIELDDESNFNVEIGIKKGKNSIKARYVLDDKSSSFSEDFFVTYTTEKPKLDISSPSDGQTFTKADKNINVAGDTDPEAIVTINNFRAIVDSDGSFSYLLQLNDGENQIHIIATNQAGAAEEKNIKVTYQPQ